MKIKDLRLVIENPSGSYKKFADSYDEYPVLGVTYPTHYGYIVGYTSEDGHDLDVFIGNGPLYGTLKVAREEIKGGIETKFILGVNQTELEEIEAAFKRVIVELKTFDQATFLKLLENHKS